MLAEISAWFDQQYKAAKIISNRDLNKAREARSARLWDKPRIKRSLLDALEDGGAQEFKQQRIWFVLWTDYMSSAENRAAKEHFRQSTTSLEETLKIDRKIFKFLTWFSDWNNLPTNSFLISCRYKKDTFTAIHSCKTFDIRKSWPIIASGERATVTFVLGSKMDGFNYRLSARDKRILGSAATDLWRKGRGSSEGKLLKLQDAAPILLRHCNRVATNR